MPSLATVRGYLASLQSIDSFAGLHEALAETCSRLGCHYYALSHHADFLRAPASAFRLHNYPEAWQHWFDSRRLGLSDPIHRASHVTACGFRWSGVQRLIHLSKRDLYVLAEAYAHGIGDGFTVPGNIPGEMLGSCSFACRSGETMAERRIPFAQIAGQLLFETGRRLGARRPLPDPPALTDRQVECIVWVGRGKTDWEIAQILGISHTTVIEHLRNARERYDASTRSMLTVRALYDGVVCFSDLIA